MNRLLPETIVGPVSAWTSRPFLPIVGRLLAVCIATQRDAGEVGTHAIDESFGGSWSWTQTTETFVPDSSDWYARLSVFTAVVPEGATEGTVTVTFDNSRDVVVVPGVYSIGRHDGIEQAATGRVGAGVDPLDATFTSEPAATSMIFGFAADSFTTTPPSFVPDGRFTLLDPIEGDGLQALVMYDRDGVHVEPPGAGDGSERGAGLIALEVAWETVALAGDVADSFARPDTPGGAPGPLLAGDVSDTFTRA